MDSTRLLPSTGHPIVWTRNSRGYNNIVVMNDDQIAVSTLPKSKRDAASDQLEAGQPIDEVLGPHGTRIRFQAVNAVTAGLNGTEVEVLYDKGGRRLTTCRFSIGAQNYFTTDIFNGEANGERLEKWGENADAKDIQLTRARQEAFAKTVSSNPAMQKVLVFGIITLGVVGAIPNALGYAATMSILLGATGLTLLWTLARLGNPPRTLSVIACQRG
jgi:hypothetical protein